MSLSSSQRDLATDLSLFLVREYLAKKKFHKTLATLYEELPSRPSPTTSSEIVKKLGVGKLAAKNKEDNNPLETLMEVLAAYFIMKKKKEGGADELEEEAAAYRAPRSASISSNPSSTINNNAATTGGSHASKGLIKQSSLLTASNLSSSASRPTLSPTRSSATNEDSSSASLSSSPLSKLPIKTGTAGRRNLPASPGDDDDNSDFISAAGPSSSSSSTTIINKTNRIGGGSIGGGLGGGIGGLGAVRSSTGGVGTGSLGAVKSLKKPSTSDELLMEDVDSDNEFGSSAPPPAAASSSASNAPRMGPLATLARAPSGTLATFASLSSSSISSSTPSSSSTFSTSGVPPLSSYPSSPIQLTEAAGLKSLIFPSSGTLQFFTDAWLQQGFVFNSTEKISKVPSLSFGLQQYQGGPCGILAVIQAYIIKELLFESEGKKLFTNDDEGARYKALSSNIDIRSNALCNALISILLNASNDGKTVRIAIINKSNPSSSSSSGPPRKLNNGELYKPDGITENLLIYELKFGGPSEIKNFFKSSWNIWTTPKGYACILFLYSIVLTHGIDNIKKEMDIGGNGSLIGSHSYCTQEMVNLALIGKAVSNVFDGKKQIDQLIMYGIEKKSSIGFLSLFEHHGYIEVGNYYKDPVFPIWVVCSESHYTVLFGLSLITIDIKKLIGKKFDLIYYDELVNQMEEIKLTVDLSGKGPAKRDELEPPINDCIRTKWGKNAKIDWNGVEPIL